MADLRAAEHYLIDILRKCRKKKSLSFAQQLHAYMCQQRLDTHTVLGNYLIPALVECGGLPHAQRAFDRLPYPNEYSWSSLISGYVDSRDIHQALHMYHKMQEQHVLPSSFTLVALLKACSAVQDVGKGIALHDDIIKKGLESDLCVSSTIVVMYGKFGLLTEAHHVLEKLPARDAVLWNSLIAGYAEHALGEDALNCFDKMQSEGVSPTHVTFACGLKACASTEAVGEGQLLCAEVFKRGFESELPVTNAIIDMFGKCGSVAEACHVFDKLLVRDVVSWNTLIASYVEHGLAQEALTSFGWLELDGVSPTDGTFISSLKACGWIGDIERGRIICADIVRKGLDKDLFVGSTMIDMYVKCGLLVEAQQGFDKLSSRDVVSWNTLIAGYAEHGFGEEALNCFQQMQLENVCPVAVTFLGSLRACGIVGALDVGQEIHIEIIRRGWERDPTLIISLIDMYGKCSSLIEARDVFDRMAVRDVVSWTALIKGYGENHQGNMAVKCFEDMPKQGVKPNSITFTCLLGACSHGSLLMEGLKYFKVMREEYEIEPTSDHYACMVDLLARAGNVLEAEVFAEAMQCLPSEEVLTALLSACKIHGEVRVGLRCFQQLIQVTEKDATPYLLMADVYASAGRWDDAKRMEELRVHAGAKKKPGSASLELDKVVHDFGKTENLCNDRLAVFDILSSCLKDKGYVPSLDLISTALSDDEDNSAPYVTAS